MHYIQHGSWSVETGAGEKVEGGERGGGAGGGVAGRRRRRWRRRGKWRRRRRRRRRWGGSRRRRRRRSLHVEVLLGVLDVPLDVLVDQEVQLPGHGEGHQGRPLGVRLLAAETEEPESNTALRRTRGTRVKYSSERNRTEPELES